VVEHVRDIKRSDLSTRVSAWKRLRFEQWELPRNASDHGMDLLLVPHATAPMVSKIPVVCFDGIEAYSPPFTFAERLGRGLGMAGRANAKGVLWPSDGLPGGPPNRVNFVPFVLSDFNPKAQSTDKQIQKRYTLPEDYVLVHGSRHLEALLAAWTWVFSAMGETTSLLILESSEQIRQSAETQAAAYGIQESVQILETFEPEDLPAIYRGASVFISTSMRSGGHPLRWAMASGVPVAGFHEPNREAILGQAGYLVEENQTRKLGAAVLSLLVQDELANELKEKGLTQSQAYRTDVAKFSLSNTLLSLV
jgi:hypothetical protein